MKKKVMAEANVVDLMLNTNVLAVQELKLVGDAMKMRKKVMAEANVVDLMLNTNALAVQELKLVGDIAKLSTN
jgi:hypothetical protein